MRKSTSFLVLAILLASSLPVLADGKFYWPEPVPPEIPYQRALLLFDGARETLILQSKYRTEEPAVADFLGWVVPVPSVPELASMDPGSAQAMFRALAGQSETKVIQISDLLLVGFFFLVAAGSAVVLLVCLLSFPNPRMQSVRQRRRMLMLLASTALLLLCTIAFMCWIYVAPRSAFNPLKPPDVEVIKAEQVGIYDVQVVKANQSQDLIQWLDQNQFQFDDTDIGVFDQYLQRGWCFVVARINTTRLPEEQEIAAEGLVAPLIVRFEAEDPVYPLALTATSAHETQILLYVLSENKWQNDGRLDLLYASKVNFDRDRLYRDVEPAGFFSDDDLDLPFLCKFKGTLTPEQMREDLTLTLAGDSRSYGRYRITW